MENEWKLSHSGQLGYLNAIYDLMDYRKSTGVSSDKLFYFRHISEKGEKVHFKADESAVE